MSQFDHPAPAPAGAEPGQAPPAATAPADAGIPAEPSDRAITPPAPTTGRISFGRAIGELLAVYAASFGLGIVSAIVLLRDPDFNSGNNAIDGLQSSLIEIFSYVMQGAVVIFGVGYFSLRRGLGLSALFGKFRRPAAYPAVMYNAPLMNPGQPVAAWGSAAASGYQGYPYPGAAAPGYGPQPFGIQPPPERGPGWQFARVFFLAMGGFISFLIVAVIYMDLTNKNTGAPSQGNSLWLIPVGVFVSLAAGFGEEMLITGMTVTVLEQAGFGKRAWVIYLVAICLRIPFHLYYGWAAVGVICFTVTNIWIYRRWRLLWPIVLAHAAYDFVESVAQTMSDKAAGLLILALAFTTLVMVIIIACIEGSDASARRRYRAATEYQAGPVGMYGRPGSPQPQFVQPFGAQPGQLGQVAQADSAAQANSAQANSLTSPDPLAQSGPVMQPGPVIQSGPAGQPFDLASSQPSAPPLQLVQPVQPPPVPQPPVLRLPDPVVSQPPEAAEPPQFPAF